MRADSFGDDLQETAASLKIITGRDVERAALLNGVLSRLERLYKILLNGDKAAVIHEWNGLNCTLGLRVSVRIQDRTITGIAENITDRGELLVRLLSGEIETLSAGEVTILKGVEGQRM